MLAQILSCAVLGLDGVPVQVQVDVTSGGPFFIVVGLPDAAVNESRERVRAAIKNSGLFFPLKRITVNLAPGDLRKEGPAYDLPIAIGLLQASDQITADLSDAMIIGELSLDGTVRHTNGVLSMAMQAQQAGLKRLFVPSSDAPEAALISGLDVYPIDSLFALYAHLQAMQPIAPQCTTIEFQPDAANAGGSDFQEIRGQEHVKRALEIAAAGAHNLIMIGPPGAGKTLLARAFPSTLPQLTLNEALEVTRIYSVADMLPNEMPLMRVRPFRAPQHTISHAGLVGGGSWPRPGEISLAHRGVLFLDGLPEFDARSLEAMRQPLEGERIVSISRAQGSLTFPANFLLLAAMNPCPCGCYGHPTKECTCAPAQIVRYQKKISGPLLDRIDIHITVPPVEFEKLSGDRLGEPSATIQARVEKARAKQRERFEKAGVTHLQANADMGPAEVRQFCELDEAGKQLMRAAMKQMNMSARAFHRILKLARTIADLAESEVIETHHLAEAVHYRARSQE